MCGDTAGSELQGMAVERSKSCLVFTACCKTYLTAHALDLVPVESPLRPATSFHSNTDRDVLHTTRTESCHVATRLPGAASISVIDDVVSCGRLRPSIHLVCVESC
jgi:hypothetical protein